MKTGDTVLVYPHGDKSKAAQATVRLFASSGCFIAIVFASKPPFVMCAGTFLVDDLIIMFATRVLVNGKPWGPWIEMKSGGHYEIEELPNV